jgi:hypothetical protein
VGGGRSDDEDDYGLDIEGLSQEGDSPTLTQHTPTDGVQNRTFTTNHPRQFGTGGEGRRASLACFGAQLAPENIDPVEAYVNKRSTKDGLCLFYSLLGWDDQAMATTLRAKIARYIREHFEATLDGSTLSYADIAHREFQVRVSATRYEAIMTRLQSIASDDRAHWGGVS